MNKLTWAILVVIAGILCCMADLARADGDITGYKDMSWGTEYSDMSAHLAYLGEGALKPLKTHVYPHTAYFSNGVGYGGSSFVRMALFDKNKTLIGVKLQGSANGHSPTVYDVVLTHLEDLYGKFDVHAVMETISGYKEVCSWRRMSGNVTFTHTKTGDFSTFSVLYTANKKG